MNQKLKEYLEEKEQIKRDEKEKAKRKLLFQEKLYETKEISKEEYYKTDLAERKEVWDSEKKQTVYYKYTPIEISDEEYMLLKDSCKVHDDGSGNNSQNAVATTLTVIAWIVYIVGLVIGIILGVSYSDYSYSDFNFAIASVCWTIFLVNGTMFLGFAEIIKLLESIKRK